MPEPELAGARSEEEVAWYLRRAGWGGCGTGKGHGAKAKCPSPVYAVARVQDHCKAARGFSHFMAEVVTFDETSNSWEVDPFILDNSMGSGSAYNRYMRVDGTPQWVPFDDLRLLPDGVIQEENSTGQWVSLDVHQELASFFVDDERRESSGPAKAARERPGSGAQKKV